MSFLEKKKKTIGLCLSLKKNLEAKSEKKKRFGSKLTTRIMRMNGSA